MIKSSCDRAIALTSPAPPPYNPQWRAMRRKFRRAIMSNHFAAHSQASPQARRSACTHGRGIAPMAAAMFIDMVALRNRKREF